MSNERLEDIIRRDGFQGVGAGEVMNELAKRESAIALLEELSAQQQATIAHLRAQLDDARGALRGLLDALKNRPA